MLTAVETAPLASGPPVANCGASTASTGVPAGSGPTATGSTRPVAMGLNVASPSYVICFRVSQCPPMQITYDGDATFRSEEHTSELQSQSNLVCRLLLEKKKRCTRAHN